MELDTSTKCPTKLHREPFFTMEKIDLNNHFYKKEEYGQLSWGFLHGTADYYPEEPFSYEQREMKLFLEYFTKIYGCRECREHFKVIYKANPADVSSRVALKRTICLWHNLVNESLDKPTIECHCIKRLEENNE